MNINNIKEIMEALPDHFLPQMAEGISATINCIFTGDQASEWVVVIEDGACTVTQEMSANPDLTLKVDSAVVTKILAGDLDPMRAFFLGKVKITGDLGLGMKLIKLFRQ